MKSLIEKACTYCVLHEYGDLRNEMLKMFENFNNFVLKNNGQSEIADPDKFSREFTLSLGLTGLLNYNLLGRLLKTETEYIAWQIFESLYGDKGLLNIHLVTIPISQLNDDKEDILLMTKMFLNENKISQSDYDRIIVTVDKAINMREDKGFKEGGSLAVSETEDYKS